MNNSFEQLMQQLGEAINDAITNSDGVNDVLSQVRSTGIDIFLVLEATICVRRHDGDPVRVESKALEPALPDEERNLDVSPEDLQFLKRLRISVSEE